MMEYSLDGLHLTEGFEGFRATSYQDQVGVWTIGYGHTKGVRSGMHCDEMMALAWLKQDIEDASQAVNLFVKTQINQEEFDALVDFTFNLGIYAFLHSTMLVRINARDFVGAAGEFERWDKAGGKEVAGLLRRRLTEKELFEKGMSDESGKG